MLVLQPYKEGAEAYADSKICAQENTYSLYAESFHLSAATRRLIPSFISILINTWSCLLELRQNRSVIFVNTNLKNS